MTDEWFDDLVDKWHLGQGGNMTLHEYLGMTFAEYGVWARHPTWFKVQYGVQVVWLDPTEAGVPEHLLDQEPRWAEFEDLATADSFARSYKSTIGEKMSFSGSPYEGPDKDEVWLHSSVREVNRATRWALEAYGNWRTE